MLLWVDLLEWFGQVKLDIIQAHLPFFDPRPTLNTGFALLPSLGSRIELLLGRP
jgi:hypothetical protein